MAHVNLTVRVLSPEYLPVALGKLKKYMAASGTLREIRSHEHALSKGQKRRRKDALARRRRLKQQRRSEAP